MFSKFIFEFFVLLEFKEGAFSRSASYFFSPYGINFPILIDKLNVGKALKYQEFQIAGMLETCKTSEHAFKL